MQPLLMTEELVRIFEVATLGLSYPRCLWPGNGSPLKCMETIGHNTWQFLSKCELPISENEIYFTSSQFVLI